MRTGLAIAAVELRRFLKDRSNYFFAFIFPLLLVLLIGAAFGGSSGGTVAVAGPTGGLRTGLVDELKGADVDVSVAGADDMRELVARGRADVGVLLTADAARAFEAGDDVTVQVVLGNRAQSQVTAQQVQSAVDALAARAGITAALRTAGADPATADAALAQADKAVHPARLEVTNVSEIAQEFSHLGRYDYGASSELLLFVFLISLAGSTTLIQSRRLGVTRRTLAAPVSTLQLVGGQILGRLVIAAFQGAYIMAASSLLFGVRWGNLGLAILVMVVFALVAAGAAMVLGSVIDNDSAAGGVGVGLGLVLGALGGSMYPLELFPDTLRTIAHLTPHAWASEALAKVQRHDAGLVDVLHFHGRYWVLEIGRVAEDQVRLGHRVDGAPLDMAKRRHGHGLAQIEVDKRPLALPVRSVFRAKPAGRGMDTQVTPVEREARRLALKVFTPKTLKDEAAQTEFRAHKADAAIVVAYGLILPKPILEAPKFGCFNVHASLLPRWRGAGPINRAIIAGDAETGVTVMQMDEGLDTGAMGPFLYVFRDREVILDILEDITGARMMFNYVRPGGVVRDITTTADRAKDCRQKPAFIHACAHGRGVPGHGRAAGQRLSSTA